MKKIISIALLCAMLLSCFAGCAMQKGEVDVENYVEEVEIQNAANTEFRTELQNADEYSGTPDTSWFEGAKATKEFTITTAEQLVGFRDLIGAGNDFSGWVITLGVDVDLNDTALDAFGEMPFKGTFDGADENGDNHVIANWSTTSTIICAGFFPSLASGSTIKNVSFVNGTVSASGMQSVGLIGKLWSGSGSTVKISNVYSNIEVSGASYVGGIIGYKGGAGNLVVENCEFVGTVTATTQAGGIAGYVDGAGNLTVDNCKCDGTVKATGNQVGGIIGLITGNVPTANIQGCVNNGAITGAQQTAGIIGGSEVKNSITINNCKNAGAIKGADYSAGIIGRQSNTGLYSFTVTNCENLATGTVTTTGGYCGGIVGCVSNAGGDTSKTNSLVILIEKCNNYAAVSADNKANGKGQLAGIVGGINGKADENKNYTIKVTIKDCNNSGDISAVVAFSQGESIVYDKNTHCGGIAGYIYGGTTASNLLAETVIDNCHSTGDVYANRSTGGLIGYIQRSKIVTIQNCSVDANVTVNIVSKTNQHAGGLISRVDLDGGYFSGDALAACKLTIDNCTVDGELKVIETYSKDDATKANPVYGAGLIATFRKGNMEIKNCTVKTTLVAEGFSDSKDILNYFLATKDSTATVTADQGNKYYEIPGTFAFGPNVTASVANTIVGEGVQYRINANNTADIRYVFGITGVKDGFDNAIGFDVKIKTIENDVVVPKNEVTVYSSYVYESLKGTDANGRTVVYTAGEGDYADIAYFAVVTIKGIPQGKYVVEDGKIHVKNSVVELTPFFQNTEDSKKLSFDKVTMLKNEELKIADENVTATVPSKFENAQAIVTTIDPLKYNDPANKITNVVDGKTDSNIVKNVTCDGTCTACMTGYALGNADQFAWTNKDCTCTDCALKWSAHGTLTYLAAQGVDGMLPHFYIDGGNYRTETGDAAEDVYNYFYSFTFTVEEAGTYDFCFRIRNKGKDGVVNTRYALIQINDQEFDQQTKLWHEIKISNVSDTNLDGNTNSTLQESFITGFSADLVEGENTITIRAPYIGGSNIHIRDILIVKQ